MTELKTIQFNGSEVTLKRFDKVSFEPFPEIYYSIHGFDIYSDSNLIAVYDGNEIISRHLKDLAAVSHQREVEQKLTWRERRKQNRR